MMKLAIVLPAYNEEEVLVMSIRRLKELMTKLINENLINKDSFMLFVNDGSYDRTWEIIEQFHQENQLVKGINLVHNVGHQSAIMAGMMTAKDLADGVITIDADLQDDLGVIRQMIEDYYAGNDIVYGVKVSRKADPLLKRLSAMAFYKLGAEMGVKSIFNHADFRFMSHRALEILSRYKERNLYLRGLIPMIGLPSTTVDDTISERMAGKSKYTLAKMLNLALDGITSFSIKPIYYILYLSAFFLLICLGIGVYVIHALVTGTAVPGWASVILSIWFVGGVTLLSIGIIGVYIGKIYKEVKNRPLYNIKDILN